MPKIVESCGNFNRGSITGIFSVLVEGDDISLDPVADALMGILDGHIILSIKLANSGLFPAIDPVRSLSRLMPQIVSKELLSAYESVEDLVNLDLYTKGTNPVVDRVIKHEKLIKDFLRQDYTTPADFESSVSGLMELYRRLTQE
jgi:Flagellar biosynthesis/type III secretory pathway ATPase